MRSLGLRVRRTGVPSWSLGFRVRRTASLPGIWNLGFGEPGVSPSCSGCQSRHCGITSSSVDPSIVFLPLSYVQIPLFPLTPAISRHADRFTPPSPHFHRRPLRSRSVHFSLPFKMSPSHFPSSISLPMRRQMKNYASNHLLSSSLPFPS